MPPRSSTSSSEPQNAWSHQPRLRLRAAAAALGCLLAFEFGVIRSDAYRAHCGREGSVGQMDVLAARLSARPDPAPRVVVFGSSRAQDGVDPVAMEAALGLRRGAVRNLAVMSGTPLHAREIRRRNAERLRTASVVLVVADDWWPNGSMSPRDGDFAFADDAWLRGAFDTKGTIELALGRTWETFGRRTSVRRDFERFLAGRSQRDLDAETKEDDRALFGAALQERGPATIDATAMVEEFHGRWTFRPARLAPLADLVRECEADGTRVLVAVSPTRRAYADGVAAAYPGHVREFESALRDVVGDRILPPLPADTFEESHFYDAGHFAREGSRIWSERLAEQIRAAAGDALR